MKRGMLRLTLPGREPERHQVAEAQQGGDGEPDRTLEGHPKILSGELNTAIRLSRLHRPAGDTTLLTDPMSDVLRRRTARANGRSCVSPGSVAPGACLHSPDGGVGRNGDRN